MDYEEFLATKTAEDIPTGLSVVPPLNPMLFPFQHDIVRWALIRGRAAIFADCGLGKTPMQLEWARHIPGRVLIVAPLAVSRQTIREGVKFGVDVAQCQDGNIADIECPIVITNYERLHHFNPEDFTGIVLDESSILKSYTGKYRTDLIENWGGVQYRLACTATPAPNDFMELGSHAEFLGVMSRAEMLAMFFVHDGGSTQNWRLKGHAQDVFWRWMCSWSVMMRKPSDLGYDDGSFKLPELVIHEITVSTESCELPDGMLFRMAASTLKERQVERRLTIDERAGVCANMVNGSDEPWLIWCNLNDEAAALKSHIDGAVEVSGADSLEVKEDRLLGFSAGEVTRLVTKPKIAGHGMNWQHCSNVVFVGLSDSYEQYYQAVRRVWRFGQTKTVNCYIITADTEGAVVQNIKRKERDAMRMADEMVKHMHVYNEKNIKGQEREKAMYMTETTTGKGWTALLGDSCETIKDIQTDTIGYTIFSPPFASLYTYSNSDRDMGNCKGDDEFFQHFGEFLVPELLRVTMPGRLLSFHCMNMPTSKTRDGYIGIRDFRGELIRLFVEAGWIYHSEVCIWKDPLIAATRTKALGLMHKQICKDSSMCRQGIADYLVTMRKPGDNPDPIAHPNGLNDVECDQRGNKGSHVMWRNLASPVWMDIDATRTLQYRGARSDQDERHICPLQLDVIERGLALWSKPGDVVYSPFMGIGSEGHCALKAGRKFIGCELKPSYYAVAIKNLEISAKEANQGDLFGHADV
jgi:superfamily II DNA or RNA helicase